MSAQAMRSTPRSRDGAVCVRLCCHRPTLELVSNQETVMKPNETMKPNDSGHDETLSRTGSGVVQAIVQGAAGGAAGAVVTQAANALRRPRQQVKETSKI